MLPEPKFSSFQNQFYAVKRIPYALQLNGKIDLRETIILKLR